MTYEEALRISKIELEIFEKDVAFKPQIEFQKLIVNALEKQIPKKPIFNSDMFHFCPTCVEINHDVTYDFLLDKPTKYCRRCGQAIDWSDNE